VEGFNITEAITASKDYLLRFGGHPMAAGLSLLSENLPIFRKSLKKTSEAILGNIIDGEPTLQIDAWIDFSSLSLDLANSIEKLAPFGPGNPALVFATHGLTLESEAIIGSTGEHRRLRIVDEKGTKQEVLWWNSETGEDSDNLMSPGIKFDLAYFLRANSYRGERRLSLEMVDFRITEQKPIEVSRSQPEIHDLRHQSATYKIPTSALVWAEGPEKTTGKNRYELYETEEFAIWTTPPSPKELHTALLTVKPRVIYLFGVTPKDETPIKGLNITDNFLSQFAGLTKYAMRRKGSKVKISELAAATAQREITIRLGLEWLAAGGHLMLEHEGDEYYIQKGEGSVNPYLRNELYTAIKGLLEETYAYRIYFSRAEANSIFSFQW
jgi:single-stranded-DNA-specific exonuclease